MSKLILSLCCLIFMPLLVSAQDYEYGSPAELKGVTRIFVDAGSELKARNSIVEHIQKELPGITITDTFEDAEIVLTFGSSRFTRYLGSQSNTTVNATGDGLHTTSTPMYKRVIHGDGLVIKPGKTGRPRLLMEFGDTRGNVFERKPSTNFAREFVKQYKKANGEEKK